MKLTIEGKSDEIKDLFGDAVMTKNVNNFNENKIKKLLSSQVKQELNEQLKKCIGNIY